MSDNGTEAAEIIEVARQGTTPHEVAPGKIYVLATGAGYQTIDLTGDKYRDIPKRKSGTVTVRDVASLAQYYLKHSDGNSEVFADLDNARVTAVLDAHVETADGEYEARWQEHRVVLVMQRTPEWLTWTGQDRRLMSQQAFAEFIEDNASDVASDGPVTAADLLEVAQHFHASTKVTYASGKRLTSGQTQFTYTEDVVASGGQRGTVTIPSVFELGIRPIEDCPPYRITARFRYRLNDGNLTLGYHLDQPARNFRNAVSDVTEQAEEACKVTIMRGQPA